MKIALLIPDGIGIRNYLYSNVLQHLKGHDIYIIHKLPREIMDAVLERSGAQVTEYELPLLPETKGLDFFRKICTQARLYKNARIANNSAIRSNWLFAKFYTLKRHFTYQLADKTGAIISISPQLMQWAENKLFSKMMQSSSGKKATSLLQSCQPDIILCTHQRSVEGGYIMTAARQLGIKTATVVFSWDNLPKSRMTFVADKYLVWSQYMKAEMQRYYPEIAASRVIVTGTPQFEYYRNKNLVWDEARFRNHFNLPADRPIVCFSGNEPTFPSDALYLRDLLQDLENSTATSKPFILVRPSPVDHTTRFDEVVAQYPSNAVLARPLWNRYGALEWDSYYPSFDDTIVLCNLVHHCAAVINVGSTMGIDFSQHNKPALYLRYNHPDCAWLNLVYAYEHEHFRTLDGLDAVVWVYNRESFLPGLLKTIESPQVYAPDRLAWRQRVTDDIYDASQRVANALLQ